MIRKQFAISPGRILELLEQDSTYIGHDGTYIIEVEQGFPRDSKAVAVSINPETMAIILTVESKEFKDEEPQFIVVSRKDIGKAVRPVPGIGKDKP